MLNWSSGQVYLCSTFLKWPELTKRAVQGKKQYNVQKTHSNSKNIQRFTIHKKTTPTDLKSSLKEKKKKGLQPRFKEEKKEWADLICIVKLQQQQSKCDYV